MAHQIYAHEGYPNIFIIEFSGLIEPAEVLEACEAVVQRAEGMARPVFQIGDWRKADGSFSNVMGIVRIIPQMNKLYNDNKITGPLIVNEITNPWLRLSRDLARRMMGMQVFGNIEDAVGYIIRNKSAQSA